jgi:cytochrome c oxidase subunit 3
MSVHTSSSNAHAHHWETSIAPFAVVLGIFLALPLGFSAYFVYQNTLLTVALIGLGVPTLLFGVARWTTEGLTHPPLVPGLSMVAMPVFIVSEAFIFLALFATYWLIRLTADAWPPMGSPDMPVALPLIMTVLLVSSSVTIHFAEEKLEHGDTKGFIKPLVWTIVLGTVFLGCTIYEYSHLFHVGFTPSTNAFGMIFFTVTGFHASHVFLGLCAFVAVLIPALKGRTSTTFLKCVSVYWHFVDLIWFFVVSQIYFW